MTREEAIIDLNALKFILDNDQYTDEIEEALDTAIFALQQPERKTGKWIPVTKIYKVKEEQFPQTCIEWIDATEPDEVDGVRCSECGTVYDFTEARNWCSECGADMREGETE